MQKKYIVRNIQGGLYQADQALYYPFISMTPTIVDSEQDALDMITLILSQDRPEWHIPLEIVPVYI